MSLIDETPLLRRVERGSPLVVRKTSVEYTQLDRGVRVVVLTVILVTELLVNILMGNVVASHIGRALIHCTEAVGSPFRKMTRPPLPTRMTERFPIIDLQLPNTPHTVHAHNNRMSYRTDGNQADLRPPFPQLRLCPSSPAMRRRSLPPAQPWSA